MHRELCVRTQLTRCVSSCARKSFALALMVALAGSWVLRVFERPALVLLYDCMSRDNRMVQGPDRFIILKRVTSATTNMSD